MTYTHSTEKHPWFDTRLKRLATFVVFSTFATIFWLVAAGPAEAARASGESWSKAQIQRLVIREAKDNGVVPPSLALAVARVESDFRPYVESSAGARGVMQIMPRTARTEFGVKANRLWDPVTNVRIGVAFLEQLYHQYGGRWHLALSHYNGGTLKGRGAYARPHSYTRKYVTNVMKHQRDYQRQAIVAKLDQASENTQDIIANGPASRRKPLPYWAYERPDVDQDWRHYLKVADRALDRVTDWREESDGFEEGDLDREDLAEADIAADDLIDYIEDDLDWGAKDLHDRVAKTRDRFRSSLRERGGWRDFPG